MGKRMWRRYLSLKALSRAGWPADFHVLVLLFLWSIFISFRAHIPLGQEDN